jgi:hypothetical protein
VRIYLKQGAVVGNGAKLSANEKAESAALFVNMSTGSRHTIPSAYGYDPTTQPKRITAAVEAAIEELDQAEPRISLEPVPAAWVLAPYPEQAGIPGRRRRKPEPVWRDPDEFLRWDFLPKVLAHVPIGAAMADTLRRPAFLSWCYALLDWTNERLNPSWTEPGTNRRDRRASELIERSLDWQRSTRMSC